MQCSTLAMIGPLLMIVNALAAPLEAAARPIKLSFLLTNDIHGHLTPNLTTLATLAQQIRTQPEYLADEAGLFILDSGDQFQGTLLSNYDEGQSVFQVLNEVGYDAVVPGNHDYDFGPLGWLYDQVTPGSTSNHPREVIESLAQMARFPLLSANTYLKNTILFEGQPIALNDQCRPLRETPKALADFEHARHPDFLIPYRILKKAGVRVALIGLDHSSTSSMTTKVNVSDLCFRDEVETYLELRKQLQGLADVFVILMHNGNAEKTTEASAITRAINSRYPGGVQLVAAGHTHFVHDASIDGVHVVQNGANGKYYGRVDLFFDPDQNQTLTTQSRSAAGLVISPDHCENERAPFVCEQLKLPILSYPKVDEVIARAEARIAPLAKKHLARTTGALRVNRINESPLGNLLSDELRRVSGAEVAFLNTGGIRAPLPEGDIRYETLFETLPFQNQAVFISKLPWSILKATLSKAIQTCGQFGTLAVSGVRIRFERNCRDIEGGIDPKARLSSVTTLNDEILFDDDQGIEVSADHTLSVATLDFIASGGSGYSMMSASVVTKKLGILRELIADDLSKGSEVIAPKIDDRFKNCAL